MSDGGAFYQVSLLASFVAGMVALFAPCCISYLLPAYLGNVFKEKRKILLLTGVYSAGIFTIMLPIVLGAKMLADFFFRWHTETYIAGGSIMLAAAVLSLLGIKLPMPRWQPRRLGETDILSTFVLGLTGGVTSACCAPVLIGVLALSSLTPNLLQALMVGVSFVFGMVAPLFAAALVIKRVNLLEKPLLSRRLFFMSFGGKSYPVFVTNLVSAIMFGGLGLATLILVFTGRLSMPAGPSKIVNDTAWLITQFIERWPVLNAVFVLVFIFILCWLVKLLISRPSPPPRV